MASTKSTSVLVLAEMMVESTSVRVSIVPEASHPAPRRAAWGCVIGYGGVLYDGEADEVVDAAASRSQRELPLMVELVMVVF